MCTVRCAVARAKARAANREAHSVQHFFVTRARRRLDLNPQAVLGFVANDAILTSGAVQSMMMMKL